MELNSFGLNRDLSRLNAVVWEGASPRYEDYSAHERNADCYSRAINGAQLDQLVKENFVSDAFQERHGLPSLRHLTESLKKSPDLTVQALAMVDKAHTCCFWVRLQTVGIDELPPA